MAAISPYNRDVFSDADFAPSYVTDLPAPQFNAANDTSISTSMSDTIPSTSGSFVMTSFSRLLPVALEFSQGVVRPLPKVGLGKKYLLDQRGSIQIYLQIPQ